MAGLQTIINKSNGMTIDRRKVVGVQITRNEIPRVSLTPTKQPWRFVLDMPSNMRYDQARSLLEEIDRLDRYLPETVSFSNVPGFSWMFFYQGQMSNTSINACTVASFTGNQLVLNVPSLPDSTVMFEPNDLIQIGGLGAYPFPFTSTTRVLRGTGSQITITTNRPNILTGNLVGLGIRVGNDCQFRVFCPNMPTYRLMPGGTAVNSSGQQTSNAYIEWNGQFQLYEYVGAA